MSGKYRGSRSWLHLWKLVVLLSLVIVVAGGSYLGVQALLKGRETGSATPRPGPTAGQSPSATPTPPPTEAETLRAMSFGDVAAEHPNREAVCYAVDRGYLTAPDGAFDPGGVVSHVEACAALSRAVGSDQVIWTYGKDDGDPVSRKNLAALLKEAGKRVGIRVEDPAALVVGGAHPELGVSRAQLAQALLNLDAQRPEETVAWELAADYNPPTPVTLEQADLNGIQSAMEASLRKHGVPGAQVAVIKEGEVVAELTAGWATKDTDPMTTGHKLRVASISKMVVGMEIMSLAEEGAVDLDRPIGDYWKAAFVNPSFPDDPITMGNILTHTSSIIAAGDNTSRAYADVKALLSTKRGYTSTRPGDFSGWAYNNYAFSVLGMTAELATGKTMDQILREQFGLALGIDAAYGAGGIRGTDMLTTLYREDGTPWRTPAQLRGNVPYAAGENGKYFAGGLAVSAGDLGKLVAVLANDGQYQGLRLLKPETVALMEKTLPQPHPEEGYYQARPLDYQPGLYGREGIYYHNGNAYGAFTCASYDPHTGDGVVVLTNGGYPAKRDGVYIVCNEINAAVYAAIQ